MDNKFRRLYLHEIAFNLTPQPLFCTKAKNTRESRKRNIILKCLCPQVDVFHHNAFETNTDLKRVTNKILKYLLQNITHFPKEGAILKLATMPLKKDLLLYKGDRVQYYLRGKGCIDPHIRLSVLAFSSNNKIKLL